MQRPEVGARVGDRVGQGCAAPGEHVVRRADPVRGSYGPDLLDGYALCRTQRGDRIDLADLDRWPADPEADPAEPVREPQPGEDVLGERVRLETVLSRIAPCGAEREEPEVRRVARRRARKRLHPNDSRTCTQAHPAAPPCCRKAPSSSRRERKRCRRTLGSPQCREYVVLIDPGEHRARTERCDRREIQCLEGFGDCECHGMEAMKEPRIDGGRTE